MKSKKAIMSLLEYLLAFFMILECRSVYMYSLDFNVNIQYLFLVILALLLILKYYKIKKVKKRNVKNVSIILLYFSVFAIFSVDNKNLLSYIIFVFSFLGLYILYKEPEIRKRILVKISQIITIIAIISLIMYFGGYVFNIIKPTSVIIMNWGIKKSVTSYFNLFFLAQRGSLFGGKIIQRNTGVFVEAPMYSLILTIALAIELFGKEENKKNKVKILILMITIVTTISSTGIIVMALEIFFKIFYNKRKGQIKSLLKIILIPIVVSMVLIITSNLLEMKSSTDSYKARTDDYVSTLKSFAAKPIFGHGFGDIKAIVQYMDATRDDNGGRSNSLQVVISEGGGYLFSIYIVSFISAIKYALKNKDYNILAISNIMLILFITTNFAYNYILLCFMAMALNSNNKGEKERINEKTKCSKELYL